MAKIKVLNPTWSLILDGHEEIETCLSFRKTIYIYKQVSKYKKIKVPENKVMTMVIKDRIIYTGLIPRLERTIKDLRVIDRHVGFKISRNKAVKNLKGIKYRPYQKNAILSCLMASRGVIIAPTGTGKTEIIAGLIKSMEPCRALVLAHTKVIVSQTRDRLEKRGIKEVGILHSEEQNEQHHLCTTRTTASKMPKEMLNEFDLVIIDEVHHQSNQYKTILKKMKTHHRFGFTATYPKDQQRALEIEGLVGPQITILEAEKMTKYLAPVRVKLTRLPEKKKLSQLRSWPEVFDKCVRNSKALHKKVAEVCRQRIRNNGVLLILTGNEIELGKNLQEMLLEFDIKAPFVYGETEQAIREKHVNNMIAGKINVLIGNIVFVEGLDIPNITDVILVGLGKKDENIIQAIGRGRRVLEGKEELLVWDFFDPSNTTLVRQFGNRITLYMEKGWL